TSLTDFVSSQASLQTQPLVQKLPTDEAEHAALRARVMARTQEVESFRSFVSRDARAALLLVFLAPPAADDPSQAPPLREVAHALHDAAEATLGGLEIVYGGASFASATIYDETQTDIRHLSPLAALFILCLILFIFRDPVGVGLTVLSVAWAVWMVMGGMGLA